MMIAFSFTNKLGVYFVKLECVNALERFIDSSKIRVA